MSFKEGAFKRNKENFVANKISIWKISLYHYVLCLPAGVDMTACMYLCKGQSSTKASKNVTIIKIHHKNKHQTLTHRRLSQGSWWKDKGNFSLVSLSRSRLHKAGLELEQRLEGVRVAASGKLTFSLSWLSTPLSLYQHCLTELSADLGHFPPANSIYDTRSSVLNKLAWPRCDGAHLYPQQHPWGRGCGSEFRASLIYTEGSRTSKDTERNLSWKGKRKKQTSKEQKTRLGLCETSWSQLLLLFCFLYFSSLLLLFSTSPCRTLTPVGSGHCCIWSQPWNICF